MSDLSSSPSKRRRPNSSSSSSSLAMHTTSKKVKGLAFKAKGRLGSAGEESNSISKFTWPADQLPVELFTLIVSYLSRSGVQNMRLVNKEFDRKVSEALFRTVVVPFRPEIYGITPETTGSNEVSHGSIMLQDQGMRVFQGFGRWIKRFAMSFEIDYARLASPPRKPDQEVFLTFWGPYRWPFKGYNRYSQLEGLEQTADETRTMAKALKYICSTKELGLSIDGGLGWLAGADINQRVVDRGDKPVVFGTSKFVPEPMLIGPDSSLKSISRAPATDSTYANEYFRYLRMVLEAGIPEREADTAVQMLQVADDAAMLAAISAGENGAVEAPHLAITPPRITRPARRAIPSLTTNTAANISAGMVAFQDEDIGWRENLEDEEVPTLSNLITSTQTKSSKDGLLIPNDLTNAQREMLLEMEWAQTAFMQSWAIAIIDNNSTFKGIEKLRIARLPTRHLAILRREDFWDSLPSLKCLSLAIIPDWREVKKEATSWVQDSKVPPSQAVSAVYALLTQQIGRREHIKELHFEWLCGGEYAPGLFARNQNIVAAPLVSNTMHMVDRSHKQAVLDLPHIEHLSLKNCWISPHILHQFLKPMRQGVLQSISFDSVSLTSSIPPNVSPNPITQVAQAVQNAQNAQNAQIQVPQPQAGVFMLNMQQNAWAAQGFQGLPPVQPVVALDPNAMPDWLETPRHGSWADVINRLTPSTTLEDIRYTRGFGHEPEPRERTKLTKLSFESCGYVRVPLDFDQGFLEFGMLTTITPATITKRITDLEGYKMTPEQSFTLATIINYIDPVEAQTLGNVWNLNVDSWLLSQPELVGDAHLDGVQNAGLGRFDGLIEIAHTQGPPSNRFS